MIITDKNAIIGFLNGQRKDYRNRMFQDILQQTDEQLELCHDAIQQIFPLHEASRMAQTFPVVNKEIIEEAKKNPSILANLRKAKDRFERFLAIGQYEDVDKQRRWCRPHNHNLLRVTRIIRSLRLFGLEQEALEFHNAAVHAADRFGVGDNTYRYWAMALTEDVWETLQA